MSSAPGDTAERGQGGRRRDDNFDAGSPDRVVVFGKYLLLGKIGRGGMAEVYRARAASGVPPDLLAVKCMRQSLARENRFVEMFIREGKLAMMLNHSGIVRTFDVGSVDGRYFICMEYLGGKDLNHILRRCQETGRRVPIPHALYIGHVVCQALHYAHTLCNQQGRALNIVNRDVSPSNVRVSYDGQVKLIDFGIAQALNQITSEIGVLKGKFSYMSPEQIRGLPLDRRTDIFSTGIVLHEMLSCERLFRDDSEFVLMEMVRRAEVKPPSAFNPRVPPEIDAVVMRSLAREPEVRYQDAESLGTELQRLLQSYQFSQAELGELARGLFPGDYRKEQAVVNACLTGGKAPPDDEPEEAEQDSQPSPQNRHGRGRYRASASRRKQRRASVLWTAAIVLLVAGITILVLALR